MDKNVIVIDLDGTITLDDKQFSYEHKAENPAITAALKKAKAYGYDITISTSRNMRTYQGDVSKIKQFTQPTIENWLKRKDIPYDQLVVGKPWCGPAGFYVDDKNLHLDEFIFRFGSVYADQKIGLILSDKRSLSSTHWHKLSRLFDFTSISVINEQQSGDSVNTDGFQISCFSTIADFLIHSKNDENTFYLFVSEKMNIDLYSLFFTALHKLNYLSNPSNIKINFYHFLDGNDNCILDRDRLVSLISKKTWLHVLSHTKLDSSLVEKLHGIKFELNLPFIDSH